ncbi:MAG: T9SS type A sorting domain-containing protein [bacterium]
MKKITLLLLLTLGSTLLIAQSTSFESAEGFSIGSINGQNSWSVFAGIPDGPQITNSQATEGTFSLQIVDDALAADGTSNGAFSPGFTSVGDATLTVDVDAGPTGLSDVHILTQSPSQAFTTARVNFNFQDNILVLDDVGSGLAFQDTGANVPRGTTFEFTIEHRFSTSEILYYLNGSLIYTGGLVAGTNVEEFVLFTDNFGSDAFFDNVQYSDDTLSIGDEDPLAGIRTFPNPVNRELTISFNQNIGESTIEIINITGQTVLKQAINGFGQQKINTSALSTGMYLAKITNGESSSIKKFIKN